MPPFQVSDVNARIARGEMEPRDKCRHDLRAWAPRGLTPQNLTGPTPTLNSTRANGIVSYAGASLTVSGHCSDPVIYLVCLYRPRFTMTLGDVIKRMSLDTMTLMSVSATLRYVISRTSSHQRHHHIDVITRMPFHGCHQTDVKCQADK